MACIVEYILGPINWGGPKIEREIRQIEREAVGVYSPRPAVEQLIVVLAITVIVAVAVSIFGG